MAVYNKNVHYGADYVPTSHATDYQPQPLSYNLLVDLSPNHSSQPAKEKQVFRPNWTHFGPLKKQKDK